MKVYLCALAKNEHLYINEWVNHYLKLGVDKIFIFDNDNKDAPYIGDYIDKECLPKIRIINARGVHRPKMQHDFYTNFYNIQKDNFDWCIFCDVDEFLVGIDNIKDFLRQEKFRTFEQIRIKWKLFGDDNLITRDTSKPVLGAFKRVITSSLNNDLITKGTLENQGKAIVRGHMKDIWVRSPHFAIHKPNRLLRSCLPNGKECYSCVQITEDYSKETVFFNHYMTKSLSEFINQKLDRGDAIFSERQIKLNYYWRINKKTNKKIEYLRQKGFNV